MTTGLGHTAGAGSLDWRGLPALRNVIGFAALLVFAAAGVWVSYHNARWQWHIEGDIAGPYLVWTQVMQDGVSVLKEWRYAQDGWLLSLFLPEFVLFALFGTEPVLVMLQGWAFFLLSCLLFYALAVPIAGRRVGAIAASTMLFAGPAVLGGVAYLSYPVTHDISLLWGLAGLVCMVRWLRKERPVWLGLGSAAFFVGEVSDPWLTAALVLPVALGAVLTAWLRREHRRAVLSIAACAAAVFALARTRVFGLLWFLPGTDFGVGHLIDMWRHLGWTAVYTTVMFNVVPLPQAEFEWTPPVAWRVVNCVVVAAAIGWALSRIWRARREMRVDALFLAICCAVACAAIAFAFVISNVQATLLIGRYLSNWFYLLPVVVVCALFGTRQAPSSGARLAAGVWCGLFVAAGVAATPGRLLTLPRDFATSDTRALIAFLESNHLTYGYAPFWSTNGAVAQWLTNGRIVIRPVSASSSGRIAPRIAQTFPSWFEPSDVPPGQKDFFFIGAPDGEICPNPAACEALARHDFGPPDRTLKFGDIPVMVWHRPLLTGLPVDDLIAAAPVLEPGRAVSFGRGGAGVTMLWRGWSGAEDSTSWTDARESVVMIHLPEDWTGDAVLEFVASAFPARTRRAPQVVTLQADGRTLATWTMPPWDRKTYRVTVPADIAARRRFPLLLRIPGATRPSDLRYVFDIRPLGVSLATVTLKPG